MSDLKTKWLEAPAPTYDVESFLSSFIGNPAPIDTDQDGYLSKAEILAGLQAAGAGDDTSSQIMIDSFFDVLDPTNTGKVRTDIVERTYIRLGQYNAISWIKQLLSGGKLQMYTLSDGKNDCFFTKDEIQRAFARQLSARYAARETDKTFSELDVDSSSYVGSAKLQTWYYSQANADLRAISLRLRSRTVASMGACAVQQSAIIEEVERQVGELLELTSTKIKKQKRAFKRKNSPESIMLNRLVNRLHGIHDFMASIGVTDTSGNQVFDATLSDSIMVPIREAYKLGAIDPNAPPKQEDSDED